MAYAARHRGEFMDPQLQSEFEALVADLKEVPLIEATRAVAEHRVRRNGAPYEWRAENMVFWLSRPPRGPKLAAAGVHFEITPAPAPSS
jgi:hypothetical protein